MPAAPNLASQFEYNFFRNYDASLGRYVQSDPIGLDGGWNTYAYVLSDPLDLFDQFGAQSKGGFMGLACAKEIYPGHLDKEKCDDGDACTKRAKDGINECNVKGNVILKWFCIYCWEIYAGQCPGKTPAPGCDGLACFGKGAGGNGAA